MKVLLYANKLTSKNEPYFFEVLEVLIDLKVQIGIYKDIKNHFRGRNIKQLENLEVVDDYRQLKKDPYQYLLSLGGDGTILNSVLLVRDIDIPILGINLGTLGYLSSVEKNKIEESIRDLSMGYYKRSEEQRLNSSHVAISYAVFCLNY